MRVSSGPFAASSAAAPPPTVCSPAEKPEARKGPRSVGKTIGGALLVGAAFPVSNAGFGLGAFTTLSGAIIGSEALYLAGTLGLILGAGVVAPVAMVATGVHLLTHARPGAPLRPE